MSAVASIYDDLFNFESTRRKGAYPIHKKLKTPAPSHGLIDLISSFVHFQKGDEILDAGCGTGYTLFHLAQTFGVNGTGISLSELEVGYARDILQNTEMKDNISFEVRDFDSPIEEQYDKIIAIESLKHSKDIRNTLSNLTAALKPKGQLVIADDFAIRKNARTELQKDLWSAPSFISAIELEQIMTDFNTYGLIGYNLTDSVKTRNAIVLNLLIAVVSSLMKMAPKKYSISLKTYLGGLYLEHLYTQKSVSYLVFIATKKTKND